MSQQESDGSKSDGEEYECPTCDYVTDSEIGVKTHYGKSHEGSISGVETQCHYCGDTIRVDKTNFHKTDNNFCKDKNCYREYQSENVVGEKHHNYTSEVVPCGYCGKPVEVKQCHLDRFENHFCNPQHHGKYRSEKGNFVGNKNPAWVEGNTQIISCTYCDKSEKRSDWEVENRDNLFCSHSDCYAEWMSENMVGENHPLWDGGRNDIYYQLRDSLDARSWGRISENHRNENDRCRLCGVGSDLVRLHCHHIIPVLSGGTNGEYNRMSLCNSCHQTVENYTKELLDYNIINDMSITESPSDS